MNIYYEYETKKGRKSTFPSSDLSDKMWKTFVDNSGIIQES